jgi:hypothetical protein
MGCRLQLTLAARINLTASKKLHVLEMQSSTLRSLSRLVAIGGDTQAGGNLSASIMDFWKRSIGTRKFDDGHHSCSNPLAPTSLFNMQVR